MFFQRRVNLLSYYLSSCFLKDSFADLTKNDRLLNEYAIEIKPFFDMAGRIQAFYF